VTLRLGVTGSFTLTAQGGPVSGIQVQNPDPLDLTISLGVRSLSAGASTTVHVTMVNLLSTSKTLIVNPRWADDHRQSLRAARLTGSAHP
jgi:hypothetical protein